MIRKSVLTIYRYIQKALTCLVCLSGFKCFILVFLTLYLLVLSADLANSLDPDQAPENFWPFLGLNCLRLMVVLKECFLNANFEKRNQQAKIIIVMQICPASKEFNCSTLANHMEDQMRIGHLIWVCKITKLAKRKEKPL